MWLPLCLLDEPLSKSSYEMQMAACTGLQSRPKNSLECSFFQHLLSGINAPSIMLNIESGREKSPRPQRAYDLKQQMSGKETTTKE